MIAWVFTPPRLLALKQKAWMELGSFWGLGKSIFTDATCYMPDALGLDASMAIP